MPKVETVEIPQFVYHGTFWPDGRPIKAGGIFPIDADYVSTSEEKYWAGYYARLRRFDDADLPGVEAIYLIDTRRLPEEVLVLCLPPGELSPSAKEHKWLRDIEELLLEDRIKMRDWRFPYIPQQALIRTQRRNRRPEPRMFIPLPPPGF